MLLYDTHMVCILGRYESFLGNAQDLQTTLKGCQGGPMAPRWFQDGLRRTRRYPGTKSSRGVGGSPRILPLPRNFRNGDVCIYIYPRVRAHVFLLVH